MSISKLKSKTFHFTLDRECSEDMTSEIDETLNEWMGSKNIEVVKVNKVVFDDNNDELLFIIFYRKIKSIKKTSKEDSKNNVLG